MINKATRKNTALEKVLTRKINEIIQNPHHYKPLKNELAGEKRVHILKSFVLKFIINKHTKIVTFIFFGHHDKAY